MLAARQLDRSTAVPRPRTAAGATQRRIAKKSRARYSPILRVTIAIGVLLSIFMAYVVLTSSLTGTSYALERARAQREALLEETMRLDDRIAALQSDQRLAEIAARLGMNDPAQIALVRMPAVQPVVPPARVAVLPSLAGMLMPAAR